MRFPYFMRLIITAATRAAHPGQLSNTVPADYTTQYDERIDETNYEHMNGHGVEETAVHDQVDDEPAYAEYPNGILRKECVSTSLDCRLNLHLGV